MAISSTQADSMPPSIIHVAWIGVDTRFANFIGLWTLVGLPDLVQARGDELPNATS